MMTPLFDGHWTTDTPIYRRVSICPKAERHERQIQYVNNQCYTKSFVQTCPKRVRNLDNPFLSDFYPCPNFILMYEISVFKSLSDPFPIDTAPIENILFYNNRDYIEYLRSLPYGSDEFKAAKASNWCFTPSGVFSRRCKAGLVRHSGLVAIDIDHTDPDKAKSLLSNCQYVMYCGKSCSGRGVFAIVKIADGNCHTDYCKSIMECFNEWYGLDCDRACTDVCRLRLASFDDVPYYSPNSAIWAYIKPKEQQTAKYTPIGQNDNTGVFLRVVDFVVRHGIDLTQDRQKWIALGSAIRSTFGDSGLNIFLALSQFYPNFRENEARYQYAKCADTGFSLGVFYNLCRDHGLPTTKEILTNRY